MKKSTTRILSAALIVSLAMFVGSRQANAQYPVAVSTVQPVVPAVVGYTARPYGLFGLRTAYQPIVAPVVAHTYPQAIVAPYPTFRPAIVPRVSYYMPAPMVTPVATYFVP